MYIITKIRGEASLGRHGKDIALRCPRPYRARNEYLPNPPAVSAFGCAALTRRGHRSAMSIPHRPLHAESSMIILAGVGREEIADTRTAFVVIKTACIPSQARIPVERELIAFALCSQQNRVPEAQHLFIAGVETCTISPIRFGFDYAPQLV